MVPRKAIICVMFVIISLTGCVSGHWGYFYSQRPLEEDCYCHEVIQAGRDLWVSLNLIPSHLSQMPVLGWKEMSLVGTASYLLGSKLERN